MTLRVAPFDEALRDAGEHDFVYLDPPYAPVSATARFTSYTAGGFDADQQQLLQRTVIRLACRRASVLLSNSAAPQIRALYTRQPATDCRAQGDDGRGPARHQLARVQPRSGARISHHQRRPAARLIPQRPL